MALEHTSDIAESDALFSHRNRLKHEQDIKKNENKSKVWGLMPVIPAPQRIKGPCQTNKTQGYRGYNCKYSQVLSLKTHKSKKPVKT